MIKCIYYRANRSSIILFLLLENKEEESNTSSLMNMTILYLYGQQSSTNKVIIVLQNVVLESSRQIYIFITHSLPSIFVSASPEYFCTFKIVLLISFTMRASYPGT